MRARHRDAWRLKNNAFTRTDVILNLLYLLERV